MKGSLRSSAFAILGLIGMCLALFAGTAFAGHNKGWTASDTGKKCVACHTIQTPGLVKEWEDSRHGKSGVDCYTCHKAEASDKDGFMHHNIRIHIIVSPKNCGTCHATEVAQFTRSHHAKAGEILNSLDNIIGEVIGGPAAVNAGCRQCHGSNVEVEGNGMLAAQTWPNTGIGRLNPDGSRGSCTACHARHSFSVAQARTPETCGKCHVGPDHPQIEIYNESKHGIIYHAKVAEMNLNSRTWVAGKDYTAAPTCTTCHMGAAPGIERTHDVGERISWTLRPPISTKINLIRLDNGDEFDQPADKPLPKLGDVVKGAKVVEILTWEQRRDKMKQVCAACHAPDMIEGHYKQFDDVVDLYNDKFAKPISAMMGELYAKGYLTKDPFDEEIEWTWFELWHHEGRRARHGASMSGPDYTWWHGMYEVSKHTYMKWIPEMREVVRKKDGNEKFADELLAKYFKPIEGHDWYFNGVSKDAVEKVRKAYEQRYGKGEMK
jgi:hydroxylamine dehydrogenase